jgi:hypothetical protein
MLKSSLFCTFVSQLQRVRPSLHCRVIHAKPTINGKGISESVSLLFSLKRELEIEFHFDVCRIAFDGDSCFNTLHYGFHLSWIDAFHGNPQMFPETAMRSVVISDPLHFVKRIRYQ